jgi:hypothetical protein
MMTRWRVPGVAGENRLSPSELRRLAGSPPMRATAAAIPTGGALERPAVEATVESGARSGRGSVEGQRGSSAAVGALLASRARCASARSIRAARRARELGFAHALQARTRKWSLPD